MKTIFIIFKKNIIELSLLMFFIIITPLMSKEGNNIVVINEIFVNGELVPKNRINDIVIERKDSIVFHYYCNSTSGMEIPFLFKLNIKNSQNESSPPATRSRKALYTNLPEDNYLITISAFSTSNQWKSNSAKIKFRVNNREAGLIKEIKKLKKELEKTSSNQMADKKISGIDFLSIGIGLAFGMVFAIIIMWFIFKKVTPEGKLRQINSADIMAGDNLISQEQFKKIATENGNLKAEIAALRGQIDALQRRGEDLRVQNKELQVKIDLLSNSKTEIEELQKQKDELFALIIHDIKNPVALIKNLVELLRSYDLTASEQHEIIDDIFTTTTRIVSLSQEVSKILALESSTMELKIEKVDMNDIVSDIARRYEKTAKEKDIMIHFKRNENLPQCEIDTMKIDDVLDNLVSNAIKFSFPGGKVQLSVKHANDSIVVDVSDKGQGLSEEDIQKAFKRGAMLSARPTGNEHSSGLGLWIVKRLIEVHKGRVWIKSAVGKGSTFSFSVPVKKAKTD